MGRVLVSLGDSRAARANLSSEIEVARRRLYDAPRHCWNELGGIRMATGEPLSGIAAFADARRLASEPALRVTSEINLARALAETGVSPLSAERLDELQRQVAALADTSTKARALLAVASLYRESGRFRAGETAAAALELARGLGDEQLASFASTEIAEWHLANGDLDEALSFARGATLTSQAIRASDSLYRAEWTSVGPRNGQANGGGRRLRPRSRR
jgi:hypothetical protein